MAITIQKVEDKAQYKEFFEFPWRLYAGDEHWVPPLLSIQKEKLDKKKNPSWDYLEGDYFIAVRDGKTVGTIAAFVNPRHNEFHDEHIAWFGIFEVENDQEAATALLKTAEDWGRSHGYDALRGPQSFTATDEVGTLVEGFERPTVLMPYNKPYYKDLIEGAGFEKVMDVYSYYANWEILKQSGTVERFRRIVEKAQKRGNITIRPINRKKLKEEFELFKNIYNTAWEKNWGFTPFTSKELDALVQGLGMIFDPDLACFAYVNGDPAGFIISVPDFNQVLQKAYPKPNIPEPLTLLNVLWHWKVRPTIDWIRIPLMGVKAEYRDKGVDLAMYNYAINAVEGTRYKHLDAGWILETNQPMRRILEHTGLQRYKTHRFYEKSLKG